MKPVCYDLFCGLGGWSEGFIAEGYHCIGFDIEAHDYGTGGYPGELRIRDIRSIHGSELKDATCIVASPPCQEYSYMAMPWSKAKAKEAAILEDTSGTAMARLNELFNHCFRIQREAIEAAGHHIPLIVENVRGAQKWVGKAQWNFGSFYLWGDVPALMPLRNSAYKVSGFRFDGSGRSFQTASVEGTKGVPHRTKGYWTNPAEHKGVKQGGDWFGKECQSSASRLYSSKSPQRKMASAMIAKIPLPLSQHIARCYKPKKKAQA